MNHSEIFIGGDGEDVILEHVILNLEGFSSQYLNFYSSPSPLFFSKKIHGRQALVTDDCHRLIAKNNQKIPYLVCHYHRPITLGHISVELLPSGACPGSSYLFVQKKDEKLLFASHWSKRASPALKKSFTKPANTLLLKLRKDPSLLLATNSRREIERFLDFAKKIISAGENMVVVTDPFEEGIHLATILNEEGFNISSASRLQKIFKQAVMGSRTLESRSQFSSLKPPSQNTEPSVVFISKYDFLHQRIRALPRGVWTWVGLEEINHLGGRDLNRVSIAERFFIQNSPDNGEILSLISEVNPSHVLIYGEGAKNCVSHLQRQGIHAELFMPPRMDTLF